MKNLLELSIISGKNNIWGNHMVSPLFFYKGSEIYNMAQVAFVKSYRTLPFDKEENYGFYDIVYVRSSKESYNKKIKDYVLKTIGGKKGSDETKLCRRKQKKA